MKHRFQSDLVFLFVPGQHWEVLATPAATTAAQTRTRKLSILHILGIFSGKAT